MTPFLVPSISSMLVAGTSLLFYTLFGRVYGSTTLAWVILLQASVAIVQMAIVPQAWLYVLGSPTPAQRDARYAMAMRIELLAGLAGGLAILLIASLPYAVLRAGPGAALAMFGALWIAGSTSHQGYFRARGQWARFAAWMLFAAVIRLGLVLALPRLEWAGMGAGASPTRLIAVYFLAPDLCRFVAIHLPQLITQIRRSGSVTMRDAARGIAHNWLYDLGSALVDNGDKILVGALLDPILLVVYFFARRIGSAISFPIEPAYAELHRRLAQLPPARRAGRRQLIYFAFLAAAIPAALALAGLVKAVTLIGPAARLLPDGLIAHLPVLLALLVIECGVSVNRWNRYVAQRGWMSSGLLLFRLALRLIFGIGVFALVRCGVAPGAALVLAYALTWAIETGGLLWLLRRDPGAGRSAARAPPLNGVAEYVP